MPYIDPTVRFWLGVIITIASGITTGAAALTNMFPADWIPHILAWCAFFAFAGNIVLTALNGMAATVSSRIASAAAIPEVKSVVTTHEIANSTAFAPNEKVVAPTTGANP